MGLVDEFVYVIDNTVVFRVAKFILSPLSPRVKDYPVHEIERAVPMPILLRLPRARRRRSVLPIGHALPSRARGPLDRVKHYRPSGKPRVRGMEIVRETNTGVLPAVILG